MRTESLHILQHSLGVDQYGRGEQYRNHFVTDSNSSDGKLCDNLVKLGLMKSHGSQKIAGGMTCYSVTPEGVEAVAFESPNAPKKTRGQKRYQDYLNSDCAGTFGEWLKMRKR